MSGTPAKLDAVRTLRRRHELGRRVRSLKPRPSTCRPEASLLACHAQVCRAWLTKVNALIAFYLSNAPLRANAAKGVTGYDQATLIRVGRDVLSRVGLERKSNQDNAPCRRHALGS